MAKPFKSIFQFTVQELNRIGDYAAVRWREIIRKEKYFSNVPYTPKYRELKMAGKAGARGVPVSSTSGVPDLTLSGKMLNSAKRKKTDKTSVTIGISPQYADIAEGNAKYGRDITDKKLLEKVGDDVVKDINKIIDRKIKATDEKINLTISVI